MTAYGKIAVIGMHVDAPGAPTLDAFWDLIRSGREAITHFGASDLRAAGVPEAIRADARFVPVGAPLADIDRFDAAFFQVNPVDAAALDPQIRRFLEAAWSLIESAGYDPLRLDVPVGVYAGSSISTYLLSNLPTPSVDRAALARAGQMMHLNERDALTTFVSYKLDLKGPSVTVQTMCSTSLVAVHMAAQALRLGECAMAIAGGVSINVHQAKGYLHEEGMYFSHDGHTRPFDAKASGTVFGSGLGAVLLKPLDAAVRDGDTIHAVLIGSALNNDGAAKAGFTAPSVAGQAGAITEALAAAEVDAGSIGYLEAHGTATPLGDLIELEALTRVFGRHAPRGASCCLGSAKGTFGHLDKAAGIVGFIKACLAVKHGELPPTANFRTPSPRLNWTASPFYVRSDAGEWPLGAAPRRAGVSAFGIGGTNAHAVIEQAPHQHAARPATRQATLLTWSARTAGALDAMTADLAEAVAGAGPDKPLADIAYVGHVGRSAFPHRRILVGQEPGDAARAMRTLARDRVLQSQVTAAHPPDIVFMFPGGGSQFEGMVRQNYAEEPFFRDFIDRAHAIVQARTGIDLAGLLVSPQTSRTSAIDDVRTLQVAVFTVDYALARLLMHWGIQPAALAGHSVGEYVAAALAGILSFESALGLLVTRGDLMRRLPAGGMLAVLRSEPEVRAMVPAGLHITAVNGPEQCVVAGTGPAIDAFRVSLERAGVECQPLSVGIASHSPDMQPIAAALVAAARAIDLHAPAIPLVSCVSGTWLSDDEARDPRHWAAHLTQPVRFDDALATITAGGAAVLLEVGPGQVLSKLATARQPDRERIVPCLRAASPDRSDHAALLEAVGRLWLNGAPVDWEAFHRGERLRRVALPTYPFERQRFWLDPPPAPTSGSANEAGTQDRRKDPSDWFYLPSWRRTLPVQAAAGGDPKGVVLLLFGLLDDVGSALIRCTAEAGGPIAVAARGRATAGIEGVACAIRISGSEDYPSMLAELAARGLAPRTIVHCTSLRMPPATDAARFELGQSQGAYDLAALVRAVASRPELKQAEIVVVTSKADSVDGRDELRPERSTLQAVASVAAQEYPNLRCRVVDTDEGPCAAGRLAAEIRSGAPDAVVAHRGGQRWTRAFEPVRLDRPPSAGRPWRADGVYLITGGLGRIGLALAAHITAETGATVVLLGRGTPAGGQRDALRGLQAGSARVHVMQGDVADGDRLWEVVREVRHRFGGLHGVVHAAGDLTTEGFALLREPGTDPFARQFRAKAHALFALERVLSDVEEVEFCFLLSSLSAYLGGLQHAAYAAANRFMEAFAASRAASAAPRWISLASEVWALGPEPAAGEGRPGFGAGLEGLALSASEGAEVVDRILLCPEARGLAVSTVDLGRRYRHWAIGEPADQPEGAPAAAGPTHERSATLFDYRPPRDPVETHLADSWAEILRFDRVGIEDDFFRLGGHSILAIRIVARARAALGVEITAVDLLTHPTIARLSALIAERTAPHTGGRAAAGARDA